ncbi:hypothetical protein [Dyadobacter pollutisoli]|jgi:hypothetical protein|uniref:Uncharacterized protein n=1 Tax=Dyadobacter pollutisoli TaxID=2910158 RepID=A0A9E8NDK6_9BACT|nr:hypothetical protein [Dyadobacter pollutisoli]WAC12536.1 hypothetical protein ON006_00950 [Dyadobacter pollutisoli]
MPQKINKIKLSSLFTVVLLTSLMFVSCNKEKKSEEAEGAAADTTQVIDSKMAPDSAATDSLPALDSSASTRPEPRKT